MGAQTSTGIYELSNLVYDSDGVQLISYIQVLEAINQEILT